MYVFVYTLGQLKKGQNSILEEYGGMVEEFTGHNCQMHIIPPTFLGLVAPKLVNKVPARLHGAI